MKNPHKMKLTRFPTWEERRETFNKMFFQCLQRNYDVWDLLPNRPRGHVLMGANWMS